MTRRGAITVVLYILWMALLVGGLFWGRQTVLRTYGGPEAQRQWEHFREDMKRLAEEGPVARRRPKSDQPPALVLMRDYFAVCVTAVVVFGSLLFAMLMGAFHGAFSRDFEPRDGDRRRNVE